MPLNKMPEFDQYDILLINDMIHSIVRAQGCSFRGLWVILGLRKGTLIGLVFFCSVTVGVIPCH